MKCLAGLNYSFSENVWQAVESVQDVINNQEKAYRNFGGKQKWVFFFTPPDGLLRDDNDGDGG